MFCFFMPKRRFSQNFLTDRGIAERIVAFLEPGAADTVLEIGAGRGILTEIIAASGARLYSFEIDRDLIENLNNKFAPYKNVTILNRDFLAIIPDEYTAEKFKLIGNIPYDITSPLLEWMLRFRETITRAVITTQKELADRIAASPDSKDWAPISIFHQCFFDIRKVMSISGGAFYPPPNVKSATLLFSANEKHHIPFWDDFERIVRQAFHQRRKLLSNNLLHLPGMTRENIHAAIGSLGLPQNIRAEQLAIEDFIRLTKAVLSVKNA